VTARARKLAPNLPAQCGFTLVELMVTATISLLIVAGLNEVIQTTLESKAALEQRNELIRQASFAMARMTRAVSHSRQLLLPLADKPATNWPEHIREQTVPPSAPIGDSTLATAVLAITLPLYSDLDFDGVPDADNDGDGRIDEDADNDRNYDFNPGIHLIDDDGDGAVDEGTDDLDDDETQSIADEDPLNGVDDDGDNNIDEDPPGDLNADGCPGICGIDDDMDGLVDEESSEDDDEDGSTNEDWYDPVVFYLDNGVVKARIPVPWDEDAGGGITGRDFVISDIAADVTRLRFERLQAADGGSQLIDITLELTGTEGQSVSLNRRIRLGGSL